MRFREAVALAAQHGACEDALRALRKMRGWAEFRANPRDGEWRA